MSRFIHALRESISGQPLMWRGLAPAVALCLAAITGLAITTEDVTATGAAILGAITTLAQVWRAIQTRKHTTAVARLSKNSWVAVSSHKIIGNAPR